MDPLGRRAVRLKRAMLLRVRSDGPTEERSISPTIPGSLAMPFGVEPLASLVAPVRLPLDRMNGAIFLGQTHVPCGARSPSLQDKSCKGKQDIENERVSYDVESNYNTY